LDNPIHGSGGWDCVFGMYCPRVGPKVALVRFLIIRRKKTLNKFFLSCFYNEGYILLGHVLIWKYDVEEENQLWFSPLICRTFFSVLEC
jgi:hypothetical protein